MRFASIIQKNTEEAAILSVAGILPIAAINKAEGINWPTNLFTLISEGRLGEIQSWYKKKENGDMIASLVLKPDVPVQFAPPYRLPRKIWGVGANYADKAAEMALMNIEEPVCFMKPDTSLIGPQEPIILPAGSTRVTAEAELALIIGTVCKNVEPEEAMNYIGAFAASLDMTEQEIHGRNPRFLSRAKSFDTFFSFGPELITPDDIPSLQGLTVETVLNGQTIHGSHVANMTFSPAYIVSFFSKIMTLLPGDILMTGTPGSVQIFAGDTVECRIGEFVPLINPVSSE